MSTSLITSQEPSTEAQRKQCARVLADATEKAAQERLEEFHRAGTLTKANLQQVLAAGGRVGTAAAETASAKIVEIATGRVGCLKRIFADRKFEVGPTNGTETLASASDLFGGNIDIDGDFKNWGCDKHAQPTKSRRAEVFELVANGNYRRIFGGFGCNLDLLGWTTPEIKSWLAQYASSALREDGWAAFFFLFKVKAERPGDKDEFFVAYVYWNAYGDRNAAVRRFSHENAWLGEYRFRVVVPQQALMK